MGSLTDRLKKKGLIDPPSFLENNVHYECMMGSVAYGVSDDTSDIDVYGFCIPPKDMIFPHLKGEIPGFGKQIQRFEQFQKHHIFEEDRQKNYDITIYSIVKFFQLCMQNNPNMIDSLFVPRRCIIHSTQIGEHVRENRKMFLHKGSWHKFKGYAYSQMHKMRIKQPEEGSKRYEGVQEHGYDLKFAYHIVRLLNEIEQILTEGDLDLERNREQLKAIRRGEWTQEEVEVYFESKERSLEDLYTSSKMQHSPDVDAIKNLLLECLEMHYGSLDKCIVIEKNPDELIEKMQKLIDEYRR